MMPGRDFVEHLPKLRRSGSVLRSICWPALAQDLATWRCLEVRLGEDLAVHLDEDLFDDFGAGRDGASQARARDERDDECVCNS